MPEDQIACRPLSELRRAAAKGQAYYNCERFEDSYGRLVVGIGVRLEGRALRYVVTSGRDAVYSSPTEVADGPTLRAAVRRASGPASGQTQCGEPRGQTGLSGVWDYSDANASETIGRVMRSLSRICPDAVGLVAALRPPPCDLAHGMQVALYARRLLMWTDGAGADRPASTACCPSARAEQTTFLAGVLHDIGMWGGAPPEGHCEAGALRVWELARRWPRLGRVAEIVERHHSPIRSLPQKGWEARRAAAVVIAETVAESQGAAQQAVDRIAAEGGREDTGAVFVALCNLEGITPPRAIVQMAGRPNGAGEGLSVPDVELAVGLRAPEEDPFQPYLLRFARRDRRGCVTPLLDLERSGAHALRLLVSFGRQKDRVRSRRVIGLLSDSDYQERFGRCEALLPSFRTALERMRAGTPNGC
ncbi:MAG: hypothetical protein QGI83_01670 [Candidatus Latescibacteria bacterium]|nr:hypothetical protein [Candidatus Latescibacterota bacterium]